MWGIYNFFFRAETISLELIATLDALWGNVKDEADNDNGDNLGGGGIKVIMTTAMIRGEHVAR